jgi:hypothetical protein
MRTALAPLRLVQALLTMLAASCRSADVNEGDGLPLPNAMQLADEQELTHPAWVHEDWWWGCRTFADCPKDQVCIAVDRRPEQAMLMSVLPEPRACALVVPLQALHEGSKLAAGYRDRLLLVRKARFTLSNSPCTLAACYDAKGTLDECCNTCRGEQVWLSGFEGVPLIAPNGLSVECEERGSCEPRSCPSWLKLNEGLEIAGAFHAVEKHEADMFLRERDLTFVLAMDPQRWSDGYQQ